MSKSKFRPTIVFDGSYGPFEDEFEAWYKATPKRGEKSKGLLCVGHALQKLNPEMFAKLEANAKFGSLDLETVLSMVSDALGQPAPSPAPKPAVEATPAPEPAPEPAPGMMGGLAETTRTRTR